MDSEQKLEECEKLIKTLFKDRDNYTIVALTGYTGTGCSILADLMSKNFKDWNGLRKPEDLVIQPPVSVDNETLMIDGITNHKNIASTIFTRKYKICYDFTKEHYIPFKIIKYSHALMFLAISEIVDKVIVSGNKIKGQDVKSGIEDILKDKYRPSRKKNDDDYRKICNINPSNTQFDYNSEGNGNYNWEKVHTLSNFPYSDWDKLAIAFESLSKNANNNIDKAVLFFGLNNNRIFIDFITAYNKYLWETDCYCTDFFYHRLGAVIRATGDPTSITHSIIHNVSLYSDHLYDVVELINDLVKGYRHHNISDDGQMKECRVVIDKIRNSLEAKYLKERYSAFYLIATHEEKEVKNHLRSRIEKIYPEQTDINSASKLINIQIQKIIQLDAIEREGNNFDDGKFFTPNLAQCVADAEIHISNEANQGENKPVFFSLSEQWMKYASLIQHPALITPSSEERCMVVAYTAKFNSGCISRQVGAVITNKAHSIRTIGWNDVPYGQIPCSLREVPTMALGIGDVQKVRNFVYSRYERGDSNKTIDRKTFNDFARIKYRNLHLGKPQNELMKGMPYPYCFKSIQNEFENKKNQVHTRSLHAEENAMLQMVKYGGESLHEGIIYVTASPCELCSKKLYQIGVRKIVYIDEYPGIARENIISTGYHRPKLKQFQGAYGATYFKLYQPILPYKEELAIRLGSINTPKPKSPKESNLELLSKILGIDLSEKSFSKEEISEIMSQITQIRKEEGENTAHMPDSMDNTNSNYSAQPN